MQRHRLLILTILVVAACGGEAEPFAAVDDATTIHMSPAVSQGMRTVSFPDEDPGPPLYARVTTLQNQIFHDAGYVAIPFYRDPACVPADFDLFQGLDLPGPGGPGAFGCPLTVTGWFLIEPDAPLGTFPFRAVTTGPTPIWFVAWVDFQSATADGDFTMAELLALNPLRGIATQFHEMLAPRTEDHHVVITSSGQLDDGRRFQFNVNHLGDRTQSILIRIR
jgi:hypothetical protein